MEKKAFTFGVRYFKGSGKWYTDGEFTCECQVLPWGSGLIELPYVYDAVDYIRRLRRDGNQKMPGLSSKGWDGHMIVYHLPDGYPTLILAQE